MKRKLFLSFGGAVRAFYKNQIQQKDLYAGLFFPCCTREVIYDFQPDRVPPAHIRRGSMEEAKFCFTQAAYHFVRAAVSLAEIQKRCLWLKKGEVAQYGHLNLLLQNSGIKANLSPAEFQAVNPDEVVRLVKQAGLDIEVIL